MISNKNLDCFSYDKSFCKCRALDRLYCKDEKCKFYKSKKQFEREKEKWGKTIN